VELAGALAELSRYTLKHDFRSINPGEAEILLLEGMDRILPSYPESLSRKAAQELEQLGVKIRTGVKVSHLREGCVELSQNGRDERLEAGTVLWAAGVKASGLASTLARRAGLMTDRQGRLPVLSDLSISGFPRIFAIGDLAAFKTDDEELLPGVASVAMQQGQHAARNILRQVREEPTIPFRYRDPGSMAVIGRHAAVADLGFLRLSGFVAWFLWVGVHIMYLIEFGNKMVVMAQWAWNYLTRKNGARLIGRRKNLRTKSIVEKLERLA
jgi:NADH dehydrogenase